MIGKTGEKEGKRREKRRKRERKGEKGKRGGIFTIIDRVHKKNAQGVLAKSTAF
jgi:hypothetical protein